MRQRVLGAVRGDERDGPRFRLRLGSQHMCVAACVTAITALAVACAVMFGQSIAAPRPKRSTGVMLKTRSTRATLRRVGSRTELVVSGMPEPPIGEAYQVWLKRAGVPAQPTDALLNVTSEGNGVALLGILRGVREVTVKGESLGASAAPTSATVLRVTVKREH
jgi:hypothetical protein